MEEFTLTISVKQHPLGHFELTRLDGPLADKMLCYATISLAEANLDEIVDRPKDGDEFTLILRIEVKRQPNGTFRLSSLDLEGPADHFFVRGMLGLARDGIQAGPKGAKGMVV